MKKVLAGFLCVVVILSLAGCFPKFNEKDYLEKTSAQIEAEFGKFDCIGMPKSEDGLYRNTACGYTIYEHKPGSAGPNDEWLFFIVFDENGVAVSTYEGYRPGG